MPHVSQNPSCVPTRAPNQYTACCSSSSLDYMGWWAPVCCGMSAITSNASPLASPLSLSQAGATDAARVAAQLRAADVVQLALLWQRIGAECYTCRATYEQLHAWWVSHPAQRFNFNQRQQRHSQRRHAGSSRRWRESFGYARCRRQHLPHASSLTRCAVLGALRGTWTNKGSHLYAAQGGNSTVRVPPEARPGRPSRHAFCALRE
jgi:hypothetical protein